MIGRGILIAALLTVLSIGGCTQTTAPPPAPASLVLAEGQEAIADVSLTDAIELTGLWRFQQVEMFSP